MIAAIICVFFLFATLGMPVAFALGVAAFAGVAVGGLDLLQVPGKMIYALDKFPLLAIPLFMLAGQLMVRGGIMERLLALANAIVGRVRGGLAHTTVVSAMGMSSLSGSAMADATALGGMLGPALSKTYGRSFSAALVASASNLGPLIPPSAGMIVYAIMAGNVSVGGLFVAGIIPGILLGLLLMVLCAFLAHRRNYPLTGDAFQLSKLLREIRRSGIALMMPVIVIGGIIGGIFTPTEGAAIAVAYALIVGFFITRKLRLTDIGPALLDAAIVTSVVGALIAFSSMVTYLFTIELVAHWLAEFMRSITTDPFWFIAIVMLILVVIGMFVEANAAYVMLVPLLAPIAASFDIDPLYFGFLFVMNITLGGITPPVGILLFVTSGIWRIPITSIVAKIWPFVVLEYAVLILFMLFPSLILFLPRAFGF